MAQNGYDGLEHGVLNCKRAPIGHERKQAKIGVGRVQEARPHGIKSPPSTEMNSPSMGQSGQKAQRTRNQSNWAASGPGMQAVFLGRSPRSCGTGVFIPRREGAEFSNKPAFSPVLLPSRVVQALNLNVHDIGKQIKSKPEVDKENSEKSHEKMEKRSKKSDLICVSPEIFLPKEWTY